MCYSSGSVRQYGFLMVRYAEGAMGASDRYDTIATIRAEA